VLAAAFSEYGGPEVLRWQDLDDPRPGPDEVLVDVRACGVNHSDLDSRAGTSRWPFALPHVLGAELAGVIASVGEEVEGYKVGEPVTALQQYACGGCERCSRWRPDLCPGLTVFGTDCWGGYAERVRVPARGLVRLASPAQFVAAAAAQCVVSTAWHMVVTLAGVRAGETVLVPSAGGGVAGAAVQCAKIAGARVIATVGSGDKLAAVRALGADEVICYRGCDIGQAVRDATAGMGVDAVIDTVGGALFPAHLSCLRPDGRLATCGAHAGEVVKLDLIELFRNGHRILGFRIASPDDLRRAMEMVFDGRISVPVAATFPMCEAAEAHAFLERRDHVGKVVLTNE
jgi:NADPH:quinone reductase-like Zn-dependent oxidoreductase